MTTEEFLAENRRLGHAVQLAVAFQLARGDTSGDSTHLRTGLNMAMAEGGGLALLLVNKGIITEDEYMAAMIEAYKKELEFQTASAVSLGAPANVVFE